MRGLSFFTIVFAIAFSLTAHAEKAQKTSSNKNKTSAAGKIKKASANLESATDEIKLAPSGTADGSNVANLQTTAQAKKSPLSFGLLTFHDVSKGSIHDQDPNAYGIWRPSVRYAINDRLTLSYTQEFQNYYARSGADARWQMNDGRLQLLDSNIATLPGDVTIDGFIRVYIPTGESTRFITKRHTALYGNLNANKSFGQLDLSYSFLTYYVVNSQDYFLTPTGAPKANVDYILEHYLSSSYRIAPQLSASAQVGIIDITYRGIPVKGVERATSLYSEAGVTYRPVKNISIGASVFNDAAFQPNNDFKFFADNETYYRALVNLSL